MLPGKFLAGQVPVLELIFPVSTRLHIKYVINLKPVKHSECTFLTSKLAVWLLDLKLEGFSMEPCYLTLMRVVLWVWCLMLLKVNVTTLQKVGERVPENQLHDMLAEVDLSKNAQVDVGEFLQVISIT